MGFEWWSSEQRVRINLSETAFTVIADDMFQFKTSDRSTFINIVFQNFYPEAKASITLYLDRRKRQLLDIIEQTGEICSVQNHIISQLLLHEKKELETNISFQKKNKHISHIYRINTANLNYLRSEECKESDTYQQKLGLYLKCILEEYASLPYMERERIFFKEWYEIVLQAIETHALLKITTGNHRKYYVYPYSLDTDALSTRLYLTGLSKSIEDETASKKPASFRVPNFHEVKILRQSGRLTKEEISLLKEAIAKRKVQFLVDHEEEIHIRFSPNGIKKYNSLVYMRPAFDPVKTIGNEYVFSCTLKQAEYYFFKFGGDAEVLSPPKLRTRFQKLYEQATSVYHI